MARVFISGSFDMLHSGHITFIREAARYGKLYVGIGSDYSIEKYKGKAPVCNEKERLFMVRSVKKVRNAFINSGEGPFDFKNEILAVGADYLIVNEDQHLKEKEDFCDENGIGYIRLQRTQLPGLPARSTSELRKMLNL